MVARECACDVGGPPTPEGRMATIRETEDEGVDGASASAFEATVPDELVRWILSATDPLTVCRFSQTCRRFNQVARGFKASCAYAAMITNRTIYWAIAELIDSYTDMFGVNGFNGVGLGADVFDNDLVAQRVHFLKSCAAEAVKSMASEYADSRDAVGSWGVSEHYRFLYRVALGFPLGGYGASPDAKFALEWCASRDTTVFGVGLGQEPLALFGDNPLGFVISRALAIGLITDRQYSLLTADDFKALKEDKATVIRVMYRLNGEGPTFTVTGGGECYGSYSESTAAIEALLGCCGPDDVERRLVTLAAVIAWVYPYYVQGHVVTPASAMDSALEELSTRHRNYVREIWHGEWSVGAVSAIKIQTAGGIESEFTNEMRSAQIFSNGECMQKQLDDDRDSEDDRWWEAYFYEERNR